MAFVVAPRTLFLLPSRNPTPNPKFSFPSKRLYLSHLPSPKPLNLILPTAKRFPSLQISALSSTATPPDTSSSPSSSSNYLLSESTRTVSSILAVAFSISKLFVDVIQRFSVKIGRVCLAPTPDELATIQNLRGNMACAVGPLFFAVIRDRPSGYLNTPLTVVAAGMAKWLDIYSGVLMVRVLLSWFPNIPWDRQPLSAIRDLCDPYLNLFRNIIPPVFDTLDVSPLLAFAVLGTLGSILNNSRGMY
ncbi:ylmG homolog protein 1-2, chloroplastic-like [Magnolia sinica]|uniref:ylmG homolog protein 1-2, chloroplastic-like n=1 Tax=Magnolia sinica TaxID=86752 RepID=UPI00265B3EEE|nr:ylmG homolog protein 1-2, chloroplastic-like [Magnolia sinica]